MQCFSTWSALALGILLFACVPSITTGHPNDIPSQLFPWFDFDNWREDAPTVLTGPKRATVKDIKLKEGLLKQHEKRLLVRGRRLNVMCVGESGVGKTTLISNIFQVPLQRTNFGPTARIKDNVLKLDVEGIPFTLTFIDTPGYGDEMDLRSSFGRITRSIDRRFARSFAAERPLHRRDMTDRRDDLGVDAVLYFIAPHRLKGIDLEFLKTIQGRASIIPILAKADTMTPNELADFRRLVIKRLDAAGIVYFRGPYAVISKTQSTNSTSDTTSLYLETGRQYPWGTAESENERFSDLPALRRCLLLDGLDSLKASTEDYYENYRQQRLGWKRGLKGYARWFAITAAQSLLFLHFFHGPIEPYLNSLDYHKKKKNPSSGVDLHIPVPGPVKDFWSSLTEGW